MLLENKTAVVTGAGRGIGRAVSIKLASHGARVIMVGRNKDQLEKVKAEINACTGRINPDCFVGDVAVEHEVMALNEYIMSEYGGADILVNNAGISKEQMFTEMSMETWDEVMTTNFRSVVMMTRSILPYMIRQQSGSIINIASGAGLRGLPGSCAYSASKAAVICFTQALGDEIRASHVRCNVICPGPVDTELLQGSKQREFILSSGGDIFDPETVADGVFYLASSLSSGINSQILSIRGCNRW